MTNFLKPAHDGVAHMDHPVNCQMRQRMRYCASIPPYLTASGSSSIVMYSDCR